MFSKILRGERSLFNILCIDIIFNQPTCYLYYKEVCVCVYLFPHFSSVSHVGGYIGMVRTLNIIRNGLSKELMSTFDVH